MAKSKEPDEHDQAQVSPADLAQAIATLARNVEEGPIKQQSVHRYTQSQVTPWNPDGKRNRPVLMRKVNQNDIRVNERRLSDEEITLFNQLKPGKYRQGKWIVTEVDKDGVKTLNLYIPNKSMEDRMQLRGICGERGLAALLEAIVNEAKVAA